MARTKELTPSDEDLEEIRNAPRRVSDAPSRDIKDAVRAMPVAMHKIGVVFLFQWYAMFIYWQFLAVSLGETVFDANPEQGGPAWDNAIAWSGLMNGAYNFVTHGLGAVPGRLRPEDRRQAGARGRPRPGRGGAGLAGAHRQPVPRAGPDDRRRHLLGQRGRRALPDGRQHGPGQAHRRLHGHPQHDDRRADADRDGHVRLDLQAPPRQQGLQRDHARRRPDGASAPWRCCG